MGRLCCTRAPRVVLQRASLEHRRCSLQHNLVHGSGRLLESHLRSSRHTQATARDIQRKTNEFRATRRKQVYLQKGDREGAGFFFCANASIALARSLCKCLLAVLIPQTVHCWGTQFYLKVCPPCVRGCVRLRTICLPICLPIHLSPRYCVRGCARLRGICLLIHLSPNSFVSQVLCQGLCPPPGDLSPNSFVSQVLCQGLCPPPDDLSPNSFVSQFICLPGPCLPIHLSPRSCGRGCVRLRGIGFPIHLSPNSFVSQVLCQGLCPPSGDLSPNSFVFHHSPNSLLLGTQFYLKMCPPCVRGCVRLPGLCVSHHLSPILCLPCPVSGAVSASLGFVSPISPQTVYCRRSQFSFKRCPSSLLSPIHLFALISTHLFPNLAGGVPLSGCLQFICLPLYQLICFPVWLVVSGSSAVSNSFVSPCGNSFVSQSGWWCPALAVSNSFVLPCGNSFVSQSGWWCPALRVSQSRW